MLNGSSSILTAAGKYAAALAAENATSVQFEQAAVKVPATLASTVDEDELVARVAGEAATADPDASVPAAEAAADLADSRARDLERLRDTTASIGTQRVDRPATARLTTTRSGGVNQFGTPGRNVGGDFGANVGGSTWGNTGTNARGNDWSNTGAGTWGGAGGNTGGGTMGTSLATTDPAMAPNEDTFAEMKVRSEQLLMASPTISYADVRLVASLAICMLDVDTTFSNLVGRRAGQAFPRRCQQSATSSWTGSHR